MTAAADPIAGLIGILLSDGDVATRSGSRVFGGDVPEGTEMPQACVVLKAAGGGLIGRGFQNYGDTRIDVYCYGESLKQAHDVNLAVYGALKHLRSQISEGVQIKWARAASKGVSGIDPTTQWPTCVSSWQVLAGEAVIT
jgi:hypothetical protein